MEEIKLSGKCKELFEEWLLKEKPVTFEIIGSIFNFSTIGSFNYLPSSMQWGVYQDFGDSLNINMCTYKPGSKIWYYAINTNGAKKFINGTSNSRQQSRTAAIEKLNELINKR